MANAEAAFNDVNAKPATPWTLFASSRQFRPYEDELLKLAEIERALEAAASWRDSAKAQLTSAKAKVALVAKEAAEAKALLDGKEGYRRQVQAHAIKIADGALALKSSQSAEISQLTTIVRAKDPSLAGEVDHLEESLEKAEDSAKTTKVVAQSRIDAYWAKKNDPENRTLPDKN